MRVAVLKETRSAEHRVALVPSDVKALVKRGVTVAIQAGAGEASSISDLMYREAGAEIADNALEAVKDAKIILVVNAPSFDDLANLSEGSILVGFLDPLSDLDLVRLLVKSKVTGISMELVPRITRAQSMDALSSQATVAGYKAVLLAAGHLPQPFQIGLQPRQPRIVQRLLQSRHRLLAIRRGDDQLGQQRVVEGADLGPVHHPGVGANIVGEADLGQHA